jgi:hypothetical protein
VVGGPEQEAGRVGQFSDEGGVASGGGLGGDGVELGVQGGGGVVQVSMVFADALAVLGGGRDGVVAELGQLAD